MKKKSLPFMIIAVVVAVMLCYFGLRKQYLKPVVTENTKSEYSASPVTDGLILNYNFNKADGNKVIDSSLNKNDGTLIGGAKIKLNAENDGRLVLDGNGYVKLPKDILKGINEITVAAWVKYLPNNNGMADWQRVFDFGSDNKNYIFLSKNKRASLTVVGNPDEITGIGTNVDNKWVHITIAIDKGKMVYYENGIEIARKSGMQNRLSSLSNTIEHYIGKSKYAADPNLKGEIDGFSVYNRVLSLKEIKNVMGTTISDRQAIELTEENLEVDGIDEISSDIKLPRVTDLGVNVEWSSNSKYVDGNGKTNIPDKGAAKSIKLTAKFSRGNVSSEKIYNATILPKGASSYTLNIDVDKKQFEISPLLNGAFFEDINHGADGGVYAELVENRSFEFRNSLDSWQNVRKEGAKGIVASSKENPLNNNNPTYIKLTVIDDGQGVGLSNDGYKGITVKEGNRYDFSVWARSVNQYNGNLYAEIQNETGKVISDVISIKPDSEEWKKYEAALSVTENTKSAKLVVYAKVKGQIDLDMISLFPEDTWKGRKYGLRKDLVQILADMKPKYLRFPGGCIVEGNSVSNMYNWKDTIGPVEERKQNNNLWGYYQSYGLGFYEYFLLSEDIGAEPLPVVNVGMTCQARGGKSVQVENLDKYIQDALDLIEYANGDSTTTWGKMRIESGHPEPFNLKYLAVGNEQWGSEYFRNFEKFQKVLNERYPNIKLISSVGPSPNGALFNEGWAWVKKSANNTIVDEHYYMDPSWFLANSNRYDKYDRNSAAVFIGEYASKSNTFNSALSEAAYMTGIERNSDIVKMASYAPLYGKSNDYQWTPNLIWFDGEKSYGTPNYYVQKLFSSNTGTDLLASELLKANGKKETTDIKNVYSTVSYDKNTKEVIIKIVNASKSNKTVKINLKGAHNIKNKGTLQVITSNSLLDTNSLAEPEKVSTKTDEISDISESFSYTAGKYSIAVIRVKSE